MSVEFATEDCNAAALSARIVLPAKRYSCYRYQVTEKTHSDLHVTVTCNKWWLPCYTPIYML